MIYDHSDNVGFGMDLYSVISDVFDIAVAEATPVHIDPIADDFGYAIVAGDSGVRVDVYPPGSSQDYPKGSCRLCSELSADQARIASCLLMVAAEYVKFLAFESAAGNG